MRFSLIYFVDKLLVANNASCKLDYIVPLIDDVRFQLDEDVDSTNRSMAEDAYGGTCDFYEEEIDNNVVSVSECGLLLAKGISRLILKRPTHVDLAEICTNSVTSLIGCITEQFQQSD